MFKTSEMLLICGNNVSLEGAQALKKVSQDSGISLIFEEFLDISTRLLSHTRFNITFDAILESDFCLSLGTNIRMEATLLNVRLKKRAGFGNFKKVAIGLSENDTYKTVSLGNSAKTLIQIVEGRHPLCKNFLKAKKPMLVVGHSFGKRLDSAAIFSVFSYLTQRTKISNSGWFGINFLPLAPGCLNSTHVGIDLNKNLNPLTKKFVLCVGLDFYKNVFRKSSPGSFIVAQTAFSNPALKRVGLVLPAVSPFESEETFINLEGRSQKTAISCSSPPLARSYLQTIRTLFSSKIQRFKKREEYLSDFKNNNVSFLKALSFTFLPLNQKILKSSLKSSLSNCFLTNAVTKNSLVMAKCFTRFKQNYTNFI
ncbi:MAG: hypothetical protein COB67_11945 [SAR324 cluster bacterium]|uniref:Molybdopterin oxidoreductase domain-containing protein n=1 Tax=SAR324 cluster bacterium TaxID=2024889 RepID=A0A2A4SRW3_9DELT|nr:MAG: hypothetical protein COB67_11945 [SAR324 cluster bacterium]